MQPQYLLPYLVYAIHLGSPSQKALNHSGVPLARSRHERRVTILRSHHGSHVKYQFSGQTHITQTEYQKRKLRSSRELLFTSQGTHFHSHSCEIRNRPLPQCTTPSQPFTQTRSALHKFFEALGLGLNTTPSVATLKPQLTPHSTHFPPPDPQTS